MPYAAHDHPHDMPSGAACDIEASLRWHSADAEHCERRFFAAFELGHDILPGDLASQFAVLGPGDSASVSLMPGGGWIEIDPSLRLRIRRDQFRRVAVKGSTVEPRLGRFYPRSLLSGVDRIRTGERGPFRCVGQDNGHLVVEFNHPLAGRQLELEIRRLHRCDTAPRSGDPGRDIVRLLAEDGPGMQAALAGADTDFFADAPFSREDEGDDALFYGPVRLVPHLDTTALRRLSGLYAPLLKPGMAVLDLMASWDSHLPEGMADLQVTGLGMNAAELEHNPQLARRLVQNLNCTPGLPFDDHSFDAALCSLSLEYLTRPVDTLREVARVLRPDAPFIVSFSERWFPPKAVRIWSELHAFERMGLVLDYFRRSDVFTRLATHSLRGLPRPANDKYGKLTPWSDPLYLVWGHAAAKRQACA